MTTTYTISLIGFGGVNRALAELITQRNDEWQRDFGFRLVIVGVSDLALGSIIAPGGIDARVLTQTDFGRGGFAALSGGAADPRSLDVVRDAPADIVVEATYTDAITGEPALSHCRAALAAGRHVVTTNKGPVALAARALTAEAAREGLRFDYEGSVMSGTPVLRLARQALAGSGITGFKGILNGTSNFILGRMEAGLDFAAALSEAQAAGYAEADPAADVEGHDVRLKVVILANELLGAGLAPSQVDCSGITALTPADIATAVSNGRRWKLIGSASRQTDGRVEARVSAECLPVTHPLTGVSGAVNAVTFTTQMLGDVTITGPGAGRIETAYALLSDIIALHRERTAPMHQEAAE